MKPAHQAWLSPPPAWETDTASVHVWLAALNLSASYLEQLGSLLSQDECQRAQQFHFERDRSHFVAARGILRMLIGRYLDVAPSTLKFAYGTYGKPALISPGRDDGLLCFNLSHSQELAVYAIAWGREVGIDIEYMRPLEDADSVAQHFFSQQEQLALRSLPAHLKQQGFYNCWTRKEAYIKARGKGLSQPLDQFAVSLAPDEPAQLLFVQGEPDEVNRWSLEALQPPAGYAAALAVERPDARLACWRLDEKLLLL